jgi:SAM-dependent methyltransferase
VKRFRLRSQQPYDADAPPDLPIPPIEMRMLVGPTDEAAFDNPSRAFIYPGVESAAFEAVFDFGCGCGREARQLIQQRVSPKEYRGVDLHLGMIRWCQSNLTTRAPQFTFEHHDVFNLGFNPGEKPLTLPLPGTDNHFTLVNAHSVFTHLIQSQTEHYLREVRRIMRDDGVFRSTWFFFDRTDFPMLQDSQAAIYTTEPDLTGAVIYDRDWVVEQTRALGFVVTHVTAPHIRGFQWNVLMRPTAPGIVEIAFPEDNAPRGRLPAPVPTIDPSQIGL